MQRNTEQRIVFNGRGGVRLRVGVLISGRGNNLQALLDACQQDDYPAEVTVVISNAPDVYGLVRARNSKIETVVIDHRDFNKGGKVDRENFDATVTQTLKEHGVEFVCLAGYMRLVTEGFVEEWYNRMINIHPAILPLFPGLNTHQRAIDEGCRVHGATVHFVRYKMDTGPIIGQAVVPVLPNDSAQSLASRVLKAEQRLYPKCLKLVAEERIILRGERLFLLKDREEDSCHTTSGFYHLFF